MRLAPSRIILYPGSQPGVSLSLPVERYALCWVGVVILLASSIHRARERGIGRTRSLWRTLTSGWRAPSNTGAVGGRTGSSGSDLALVNRESRHRWAVRPIPRSRPHRVSTCWRSEHISDDPNGL